MTYHFKHDDPFEVKLKKDSRILEDILKPYLKDLKKYSNSSYWCDRNSLYIIIRIRDGYVIIDVPDHDAPPTDKEFLVNTDGYVIKVSLSDPNLYDKCRADLNKHLKVC